MSQAFVGRPRKEVRCDMALIRPRLRQPRTLQAARPDSNQGAATAVVEKAETRWKAKPPTAAQKRKRAELIAREQAALAAEAAKDLWNRAEPVMLTTPRGAKLPVTFANDSELTYADAFRTIVENPETLEEFTRYFDPRPVGEWLKIVELSEKQFPRFGLRRGVARDRSQYNAAELSPDAFQRAILKDDLKTIPSMNADHIKFGVLPSLVKPSLEKKGYPVRVTFDLLGPTEVQHATYETSPKAYAQYIRRFHRDFEEAATHFHMGLPAEAVTVEQGWATAQAMETVTILQLAAASDFPDRTLTFNQGSTLRREKAKGVVKFYPDRFASPALTHDIEVRQWNSVEHGLGVVRLGTELAQNVSRLRTFGKRNFGSALDTHWGNITGALEFAGEVLVASPRVERQRVGQGLLELAVQASTGSSANVGNLSQSMRTKIFKFLNKHEVESMLDAEAFLKPA